MSLTPFRDAALESVEMTRQRYAALGTTDPIIAIGETMNVEMCEVALLGAADMLDRDVPVSIVTQHVDECIASALASVAMTLANGHEPSARGIATICLGDIQRRVHVLIAAARTTACSSTAKPSKCEGRA